MVLHDAQLLGGIICISQFWTALGLFSKLLHIEWLDGVILFLSFF